MTLKVCRRIKMTFKKHCTLHVQLGRGGVLWDLDTILCQKNENPLTYH